MAIDISVGGTTAAQTAIAAAFVVALFAVLVIYGQRLKRQGLDDREERIFLQVGRQLRAQTPGTVRLDPGDDLDTRRGDIRAAFATSGAVDRSRSVAEALDTVTDRLLELLRPYLGAVPPSARRFGALACLIAVFGALAAAHETLLEALTYQSGTVDWQLYVDLAFTESIAVLERLLTLITGLPVVGGLLTFAWAYAILLFDWLYQHWYAVAAAFGAIAAYLALQYRRRDVTPERVGTALPSPIQVGRRLALAGLVTWGVMLVAIGVGREVYNPVVGRNYGVAVIAVAAGAAAVVVLARGVGWLRRLGGAYRAAASTGQRTVFAVRLWGLGFAVVVGPLLPAWIVVGATHVPVLVDAWTVAAIEVKLLTLLPVAIGVVALGSLLAKATGDVRAALRETLSRRSLQVAVFARGLPLAVVGTAYLLALGFGIGAPLAAASALLLGVLVRLAWSAFVRLRDRVDLVPEADESARKVLVHAYTVDTDDGRLYFARVNDQTVVETTERAAVNRVITTARGEFSTDPTPPSLAMHHADRLREDGWTSRDRVERWVRQRARRVIEGLTPRERTLDPDEARRRHADDIPADIWSEEVAAAQVGRQRVVELDGKLVPT